MKTFHLMVARSYHLYTTPYTNSSDTTYIPPSCVLAVYTLHVVAMMYNRVLGESTAMYMVLLSTVQGMFHRLFTLHTWLAYLPYCYSRHTLMSVDHTILPLYYTCTCVGSTCCTRIILRVPPVCITVHVFQP